MANTISSPNMTLPVPVVGVDPGPDYAINVNTCLNVIDSHDHSSGKGVQVTPAGLDINSDLPITNNNLTLCRSLRFQSQSTTLGGVSDVGCVYESGVDLYYNDGAGTPIRITQGGALAGTSGSISNLVAPASASYVVGTTTFVWQSAANTAANMDAGSVILRNLTLSSKGLTLNPPTAMASDYSLTLPSLPASKKIVTLDSSGNFAADYGTDNSTIEVASNNLRVVAQGITNVQLAPLSVATSNIQLLAVTTATIAANAVTRPKMVAVGQQLSASCGSYSINSSVFTDVTNLSVAITTTGRPVVIAMISDGTFDGSTGFILLNTAGGQTTFRILSNGSPIAYFGPMLGGPSPNNLSPGVFHIFADAPGTYTYKIQAITTGVSILKLAKLMVYEL